MTPKLLSASSNVLGKRLVWRVLVFAMLLIILFSGIIGLAPRGRSRNPRRLNHRRLT